MPTQKKQQEKNQQSETRTALRDETEAAPATERSAAEPAAELEFESMDLSVESVEERISPSETNVFDK